VSDDLRPADLNGSTPPSSAASPDGLAAAGLHQGSSGLTRIPAWLRWIFMDAVSARFGTMALSLVLARLMSPAEFGAFAVVVIVLLAAHSIGQLGVGGAIVSWPSSPADIVPTVLTISFSTSLILYAGCYLGAPAIAAAMGVPGTVTTIRLVALTVVISGAVAAPRAMVERRAPRRRLMIDQIDNWAGVVITLVAFHYGQGLLSLAWGRLAGSLISATIFVVLSPRSLRPGFRRDRVTALFGIGLPFTASAVLVFAITNSDQIVVGHILHARSLGFYVLAYCLASWPVTVLSQQIRDFAPAAFARLRRGPQVVGSAFMSSANLLACLTLPPCALISVAAGPLIHVLYGPGWAPAAHVLAWLAPLAELRVLYALANDYFAVLAPSRRALTFQLLWLTTLVPPMIVAVKWHGMVALAVVQILIALLFLLPWYLTELKPVAIWPRMPTARLGLSTAAGVAVGLIAYGLERLTHNDVVILAVGGTVTLLFMGLLVFRLRTVLAAVHGVAAGAMARGRVADTIGPALEFVFEPALYPATLSPVQQRTLRPVPDGAADSLGQKVRSGARWSMLNTVVIRISNFAVGVILARTVFGPTVFGLYAVSQVVITILLSANELGIDAAIVRWEGDVRVFVRTVCTLSVTSSCVIYAGLFASAPEIARLLGSPDATAMLRVLCVCVIIDGFACVPLALLTRTFAQGRRMVVDLLNFVVSSVVTVWLAFSGGGAISFAWGSVAGCLTALIAATVLAPFVVLPGWNTAQARQLLSFGLPLAGASLLTLGVMNVDSAIVGATLGPAMLGLYQLAFNISSWPVNSISQAVQRVSFAGFSRVADSAKRLAETFARSLTLLMTLTVPPCVLLATLAGPVIRTLYGPRWTPAAHALTLLAILGLMRVAYALMYDCMAASGRQQQLMGVQALWMAALIPALLLGAHLRGITGVAGAHVVVAAGLVGPAFLWSLSRAGLRIRSLAVACALPFSGGVLMAAASLGVIHLIGPGWLGLFAAGAAGLAVYLPFVYPLRHLMRPGRAAAEESPAPAAQTTARAAREPGAVRRPAADQAGQHRYRNAG
jgi:O-antigen/teichoic acid export membrane protein